MKLHAGPAYGRIYRTSADLLKDWNDGKDFKVHGGPYFSIRDVEKLKTEGFTSINILYAWFYDRSSGLTYDIGL